MSEVPRPTLADYPDFDKPPVVEVALAVHFAQLPGLNAARVGAYWWTGLRDEYTVTGQRPRMTPTVEMADGSVLTQMLQLPLGGPPQTMPCSTFLKPDGTRLIQVQDDMFVHNWRKGSEPYPRYEDVREEFGRQLEAFVSFLRDEAVGDLVPASCEVTYINHIEQEGVWERPGQLARVLNPWSGRHGDDFLPEPESIRAHVTYVVERPDSHAFWGRLHAEVAPATRQPGKAPLIALALTARGAPFDTSLNGILRSLDFGRDQVVFGFRSITTGEMHKAWGERTHGS